MTHYSFRIAFVFFTLFLAEECIAQKYSRNAPAFSVLDKEVKFAECKLEDLLLDLHRVKTKKKSLGDVFIKRFPDLAFKKGRCDLKSIGLDDLSLVPFYPDDKLPLGLDKASKVFLYCGNAREWGEFGIPMGRELIGISFTDAGSIEVFRAIATKWKGLFLGYGTNIASLVKLEKELRAQLDPEPLTADELFDGERLISQFTRVKDGEISLESVLKKYPKDVLDSLIEGDASTMSLTFAMVPFSPGGKVPELKTVTRFVGCTGNVKYWGSHRLPVGTELVGLAYYPNGEMEVFRVLYGFDWKLSASITPTFISSKISAIEAYESSCIEEEIKYLNERWSP